MFSPTCQYAIRALAYLAQHATEGPVLARDIAGAETIPQQFLSKILHQLGLKGLVRSQKGPGGGFELARPAAKIRIADISAAVDGGHPTDQCLLGMSRCRDSTGCVLHQEWKAFRTRYEETILSRTLEELVAGESGRTGKSAARTKTAKSAIKRTASTAARAVKAGKPRAAGRK